MREYLQAIYQGVIEASAKEMMGGLLAGLALSLVASGVCMLVRKRVSDPFPVLCSLMLMVSAISMALGVGLPKYKADQVGRSAIASSPGGGPHLPPLPIGRRLIFDADSDGDGRLTPEEAARFVRQADKMGKGWVDASDIDRADRAWIGPRLIQDYHRDSTRHPRPDPVRREGF